MSEYPFIRSQTMQFDHTVILVLHICPRSNDSRTPGNGHFLLSGLEPLGFTFAVLTSIVEWVVHKTINLASLNTVQT